MLCKPNLPRVFCYSNQTLKAEAGWSSSVLIRLHQDGYRYPHLAYRRADVHTGKIMAGKEAAVRWGQFAVSWVAQWPCPGLCLEEMMMGVGTAVQGNREPGVRWDGVCLSLIGNQPGPAGRARPAPDCRRCSPGPRAAPGFLCWAPQKQVTEGG